MPSQIHFNGGEGIIVLFGTGRESENQIRRKEEGRERIKKSLCCAFLPNNSILIMIRIMMMSLKRKKRRGRLYKAHFVHVIEDSAAQWTQLEHNFSILQLSLFRYTPKAVDTRLSSPERSHTKRWDCFIILLYSF